jgi:predicted PurR-regulated permease PerM
MKRRPESGRLAQAVFYGTVLLVAWIMWKVVQPFVLEIGWAVVLAICLNPIRLRVEPRLGRTKTALALVLGVLVLVVVPAVFVGHTLYDSGESGVGYVQRKLEDEGGPGGLFHRLWEWVHARAPFLPDEQTVISDLSERLGQVVTFVASQAGRIVASVLTFVFSLVIMLSILFFLLRDASGFEGTLRRVMPFEPEQNDRFVRIATELVSASVTATLLIAAVQGIVGGIVFWLLGVKGAVLWGLIMAILSFLPLVGAALVWGPVALWLAVSGHLVKGIVLALVGILILGNVDNVVRPLLLAGKSKVNTLVLIISLTGGVSAFGFIGIVLGPLAAVLLEAILESYYAPRPTDVATAPAEAAAPVQAARTEATVTKAATPEAIAATAERPVDVPQ